MFEILESAKSGDELALERLVSLAQEVAIEAANYHKSQAIEAEDLIQETLLYVFSDYASCMAKSRGQFCVWVRNISRNKMVNAKRRTKQAKRGYGVSTVSIDPSVGVEPRGYSADAHDTLVAKETLAKINAAAKACNERAFDIISLKGAGYSDKAIAEKVGASQVAVSGVIKRLRAKLCAH